MRALLVIAALCSMASASTPHARYGIQRTSRGVAVWRDSGCLTIVYDTSVDAETAKALDAAWDAWTDGVAQCGGLSVTTLRGAAGFAIDGISSVRVYRDAWPFSPDAAAVTRLAFVDDPADPDEGKILEADMAINMVDYALVAPGALAPVTTKPVLYLRAVVTHEAGHVLGLAHACGNGIEDWPTDDSGAAVPACDAPEVQTSTMFVAVDPLDDGPSTLEANDIAGACALFRDVACVAEARGGCSASKAVSPAWLALVLVGLRRRRKA